MMTQRARETGVLAVVLFAVGSATVTTGLVACDRSSPSAVEQEPLVRPLWLPGRSSAFAFSLGSSTSLGAIPTSGEVVVVGKVSVFVEPSSEGRQTLRLTLSAVTLESPKEAAPAAVAELVSELEQPFAVELERGILARYLEPEQSSLLAFGLRRQLAVVLQRAEPPSGRGSAWDGEEWDATGRAAVHYAAEPGRAGRYGWRKSSYVQVLANQAAHAALQKQSWKPEVAESRGFVQMDDTGLLELERAEVLRAELTRGQYLTSRYRVRLERLVGADVGAPPAPGALVAREPNVSPPTMKTDSLDVLRALGRSWDDVIASLPSDDEGQAGTASAQADFRARQASFHALVGLFRTDSANIGRARALIAKQDERSATLLRALAAAGTAPSVEALTALALEKDSPKAAQKRAAAALLRVEVPPPEALPALEAFLRVDALFEHGVLGLGTFSRRWRQAGQVELANRASDRVAAELRGTTDSQKRELCLLALANAGDARLFEQVVPLLESQDERVRHAAIQSVRLMDDARVEPLLVGLLPKATLPAESVVVLSALAQRTLVGDTTVSAVLLETKPERDPAVRRQATIALANWRTQYPHLAEALANLASTDADARVRESARLGAIAARL